MADQAKREQVKREVERELEIERIKAEIARQLNQGVDASQIKIRVDKKR